MKVIILLRAYAHEFRERTLFRKLLSNKKCNITKSKVKIFSVFSFVYLLQICLNIGKDRMELNMARGLWNPNPVVGTRHDHASVVSVDKPKT